MFSRSSFLVDLITTFLETPRGKIILLLAIINIFIIKL